MSPEIFSKKEVEGHWLGEDAGWDCGRLKRFETAGCSRDFFLSSCSLHVSSFLFRSFSNAEIFVFAIVSSLLRNSSCTDSGLELDLDLLFFCVVVIRGMDVAWDVVEEGGMVELEKIKGEDAG